MRSTRRLSGFLGPYRIWVILAPLLMALEVSMDLLQPRLVQQIIDEGIAQNDLDVVRRAGLLMIATAVVGMAGGILCGICAIQAAQGFGADLRGDLYRKVQNLSFGNLDRLETGGLITRLTNDVTQLIEMVGMLLRIMVRAPLLLVGSLVMAIITSPTLALLFLVLLPFLAVTILVVARKAFPIFSQVQKRLDAVNTVMQENLAGVRVIRVFARATHEMARFGTRNDDLMEINLRAVRTIAVVLPLMMLTINGGVVATLFFGGRLIGTGSLAIGELIAFLNYLLQTLMGLMMVTMLVMRFTRAEASAERVLEVLDSVPDIAPAPNPVRAFSPRGQLTFENVTLAYDADSAPVLQDVSFTMRPGDVLAILGATGSGKSSLVNLIPRFYEPTGGRILIDGVDIRTIDETVLRESIAIALQESVLFSGTIRDNIRFGRPDATEDEVIAAARMAQAHEFISALPDGYDAIVGQRGVNLSGGQKQRIAIARALIVKAPILILDDSTSAVDVATESRIQEALAAIDQTCLIVAQRISAVVGADTILVLDGGRIVASGTHDELIAGSELYRDIYESQIESGAVVYGAA